MSPATGHLPVVFQHEDVACGDLLSINRGTLYPVLLKLEQEGAVASEWGISENNRRARFYRITRTGRTQLRGESHRWEQTVGIIGRFFALRREVP